MRSRLLCCLLCVWLATVARASQQPPPGQRERVHRLKQALGWEALGELVHVQALKPRRARVQCASLFAAKDEQVHWPPPRRVPPTLQTSFTLHGAVPVLDYYFAEQQNGGAGYAWSADLIERLVAERRTGRLRSDSCYKQPHCWEAVSSHAVAGKRGIVFGSQTPWAEALLLAANASSVLTYEYMTITSQHDRVTALTPAQVAQRVLNGSWEPYDFGFSYSSFEHDGLGRYGDALNPFGDIESVTKVACLLRPGGLFFLGLPIGPDALVWNAHRIYGRVRLPLLLAGWDVVDVVGPVDLNGAPGRERYTQPVLVLRNTRQEQ